MARTYEFDLSVQRDVSVLKLLSTQYFSDSHSTFADQLAKAEAASPKGLVILDLAQAQQLTSGPLGALRVSHNRLIKRGGRIVAAGGGDFAVRVLSFAVNFIDHFQDVEAAMTSIAPDP